MHLYQEVLVLERFAIDGDLGVPLPYHGDTGFSIGDHTVDRVGQLPEPGAREAHHIL